MKVTLRPLPSGSWLDERCAPHLALALRDRLYDRLRDESGVFLTLTYDRSRYRDAEECFDNASTSKHVARFMERLSEFLGESLRGRWLCKCEFQAGGWVHWHIIPTGVDYIPHSTLLRLWRFGFPFVQRFGRRDSRRRVAQYASKPVADYASKSGKLPAWLLAKRTRSIKIVRVSPGFWRDDTPPRARSTPEPRTTLPMWVPIGARLEDVEHITTVRTESADGSRKHRTVAVDFNSLVIALVLAGIKPSGREGSGMVFDLPEWRLWAAVERAQRADGGPFHLTEKSNRASHLSRWQVDALFEHAA